MSFIIIGNGIAGISAANMIRKINHVAPVTIISVEPHPAYSACVLPNYISKEISRDQVFISTFPDYERRNIRLATTLEAISLDTAGKRVILSSESMSYEKLIIATGSKALIPPIKGTDKKGVFTFKSLDDADRIHKWEGQSVVVVGSGPIGVEASIALNRRGYRVFLMELLDWIMPQVFDEVPSSIIADILRRDGIEVSTRERVCEILGGESVQGIKTDTRSIQCDTVIMAAGMKPEVGFVEGVIKLGKSGGILVNSKMCTNLTDIYACGDCVEAKSFVSDHTGSSLLWHNARQQGQIAGSNAAGAPKTYPGYVNITGVELPGVQAVSVGIAQSSVKEGLDVIEKKQDGRYQCLILSNGVLVGAQSVNWSENMGVLLAAIMRKLKVTDPSDLFVGAGLRFPFRSRLGS